MRRFLAAAAFAGAAGASEPQYRHGVSFFGEFKYPPGFEHYDYVNPDAPKGGTLVLATQANWNSFTPYLYKGDVPPGIDHQYGSNPFLYDSLFTASDDEIGTFYGNLAEAVAVADDFSRVQVRLRPEAYWHDGEPITARDVQFTFDHIRNNSGFNLRSAFGMVESVEIHGEHEFTFHLRDTTGVNAAVVTSLGKLAILPEHYWRERDSSLTTLTPPLGSGPYRIAEYTQSKSLRYERVADYWGRNLGVHRGRHNFDAIRYDFYRDATVAREALRKGLIDHWRETDPGFWHDGFNVPALAKGWLVKDQQNFQYYVGLLRGLVLNSRREHLQDIRVREALTLAFHHDWFDRVINRNFYLRPGSYFAPSAFAATGPPSAAEISLLRPFRHQLPPRVFTHPIEQPQPQGFGRNRAMLRRALALLEEAGWKIRAGRMVNAAGAPFRIVLRRADRRRTAHDRAVRGPAAGARHRHPGASRRTGPLHQPDEGVRFRHRVRSTGGGPAAGRRDRLLLALQQRQPAADEKPLRRRERGRGRDGRARPERPLQGRTDGRAAGPRPHPAMELPHHPADRRGRFPRHLLGQVRPPAGGCRVPHQLPGGLVVRRSEGGAPRLGGLGVSYNHKLLF